MQHPPFDDFHENVAIFQDMGDELEACGLVLNSTEFTPGVSYSFPIGTIETSADEASYENITLAHRLFLATERGPSKVIVTMSFAGTKTGCAMVSVQHQSDAWMLKSDKAYRTHSQYVELLAQIGMSPDETRPVEEERAVEVIRIMARFFLRMRRPARAQC